MAMKGFSMSASVTPVALSRARWGACSIPRFTWSDRINSPLKSFLLC